MAKKAALKKKGGEKIRLTKEQKTRVSQMIRVENRISVCRDYIKLWAHLFQLFGDLGPENKPTPDQEKVFFQLTTALARKHYLFCELMADTFKSPDKILEVIIDAVSLSHISEMDEPAYQKFELEWHNLFIEMNVALGRLLRRMDAGTMTLNEMLQYAEGVAKDANQKAGEKAPEGEADSAPAKKGLAGRFSRKKKAKAESA